MKAGVSENRPTPVTGKEISPRVALELCEQLADLQLMQTKLLNKTASFLSQHDGVGIGLHATNENTAGLLYNRNETRLQYALQKDNHKWWPHDASALRGLEQLKQNIHLQL